MRNVTRVPEGNNAEQPGRQSIPAGSLVTRVPEGYSMLTVSVCGPGCAALCPNAAATSVRGLSTRSVHGPDPAAAHGPSASHARKGPSAAGTGVSVTADPNGTSALQAPPAAPQSRAERLVTVPGPPTESISRAGAPTNLARTDVVLSSATSQIGAAPMHAPSQRSKRKFASGFAVNLSTAPRR